MIKTLTVPEGFSENIANNLQTIRSAHSESGQVSEKHLEWLIDNVKHLDILMHSSAAFANVADRSVSALREAVEVRDLKILDLENRNEHLEGEVEVRDGEIRYLEARNERLEDQNEHNGEEITRLLGELRKAGVDE